MASRLQLQTILESVLGSRNVYFQPPESLKLSYPCIIYKRDNMDVKVANNNHYGAYVGYMVTVADVNPDSDILNRLIKLPLCRYVRHYVSNNMNHDVFSLYY